MLEMGRVSGVSGEQEGRSFKGNIWSKKISKSVGFFCGQRPVFLDKGITNRTIGQSLRVHFPKSKTNLYNQLTKKRTGKTLIYWPSCTAGDGLLATVNGFGFDVVACAPLCLRRGIRVRPCSLQLCVYLPCGLQVQPLDLSWPCLLRATGH